MGAKYTEAQKAASQKYLGEKTDSIQIRTPKGTKQRWREAATAILEGFCRSWTICRSLVLEPSGFRLLTILLIMTMDMMSVTIIK